MLAHRILRSLLILAAATLLGACAAGESMRRVAGASAKLTNDFKRATQEFVDQANNLNTANALRLQRLAGQTQALQISVADAETGWSAIADTRARTMYGALSKADAADVVANSAALFTLNPLPEIVPITADAKQFDSLVQKLTALATEPSFSELAQSFLAYGKQVNDLLQKEMEKSAKALEANKSASATKATAFASSVATK